MALSPSHASPDCTCLSPHFPRYFWQSTHCPLSLSPSHTSQCQPAGHSPCVQSTVQYAMCAVPGCVGSTMHRLLVHLSLGIVHLRSSALPHAATQSLPISSAPTA